jgi:spore photoproduct lyase
VVDFPISRAVVEEGAERHALTQKILGKIRGVPIKRAEEDQEWRHASFMDMDKSSLRLIDFPGQFLKPCPGTRGYICCGYQILHVGTNCPLDCSYCILQAYFNQPSLRVFVNLEEKLGAIASFIDTQTQKIFRIGTGEFTDSLALDPIVGWTDMLLPFFAERKNAVLELKTKTDHIDGLLSAKHRDRIIVSWSLNNPELSAREEHGAPGIRKRILAAKQCQEEGYALGFHFDPLIHCRDWKEGYMRTLELMDRIVDPKRIIWLSLGCFRYMPGLKGIIRRRHPDTGVLNGEFVPGLDGKRRYFKPIRIDMYGFMKEKLNQWHPDLGLYLCMESHDIWEKSLDWSPGDTEGLSRYLDGRVIKFFGNGLSIRI